MESQTLELYNSMNICLLISIRTASYVFQIFLTRLKCGCVHSPEHPYCCTRLLLFFRSKIQNDRSPVLRDYVRWSRLFCTNGHFSCTNVICIFLHGKVDINTHLRHLTTTDFFHTIVVRRPYTPFLHNLFFSQRHSPILCHPNQCRSLRALNHQNLWFLFKEFKFCLKE